MINFQMKCLKITTYVKTPMKKVPSSSTLEKRFHNWRELH